MTPEFRKDAEPIAEEIIEKIGNYLRYEMQAWPKAEDLLDMKRIVKSIIVQSMQEKKETK